METYLMRIIFILRKFYISLLVFRKTIDKTEDILCICICFSFPIIKDNSLFTTSIDDYNIKC